MAHHQVVGRESSLDFGDFMESSELAELSNDVPLEKPVSINTNSEEDSWERLYNETGELLRPDALEEVTISPPTHGRRTCFN